MSLALRWVKPYDGTRYALGRYGPSAGLDLNMYMQRYCGQQRRPTENDLVLNNPRSETLALLANVRPADQGASTHPARPLSKENAPSASSASAHSTASPAAAV